MKSLVMGATGYVGSHTVERLLEHGHEVRALARKTSDIRHLKTTGADIVFGDIEDYNSLTPTIDGMDLVFHAAAGVMPGRSEGGSPRSHWRSVVGTTSSGVGSRKRSNRRRGRSKPPFGLGVLWHWFLKV